jgi:hypothetical protein
MKSISDVVGASGLALYAEIALLIFVAVFAAVAVRTLLSRRGGYDHLAALPLDDEPRPARHRRASDDD